jgi:hypothetical protein
MSDCFFKLQGMTFFFLNRWKPQSFLLMLKHVSNNFNNIFPSYNLVVQQNFPHFCKKKNYDKNVVKCLIMLEG